MDSWTTRIYVRSVIKREAPAMDLVGRKFQATFGDKHVVAGLIAAAFVTGDLLTMVFNPGVAHLEYTSVEHVTDSDSVQDTVMLQGFGAATEFIIQ